MKERTEEQDMRQRQFIRQASSCNYAPGTQPLTAGLDKVHCEPASDNMEKLFFVMCYFYQHFPGKRKDHL